AAPTTGDRFLTSIRARPPPRRAARRSKGCAKGKACGLKGGWRPRRRASGCEAAWAPQVVRLIYRTDGPRERSPDRGPPEPRPHRVGCVACGAAAAGRERPRVGAVVWAEHGARGAASPGRARRGEEPARLGRDGARLPARGHTRALAVVRDGRPLRSPCGR